MKRFAPSDADSTGETSIETAERNRGSKRRKENTRTLGNLTASGNSRVHYGDNYYRTSDSCLADLRVTDPRGDKTRIEEDKGGLLPDSSSWILNHADFLRWRHDPHSRLLWIKGDPGKGKTMLLITIVNELERQLSYRRPVEHAQEQPPDTLDVSTGALAYFFCQATDSHLRSATAVLRGLIYRLVDERSSLVHHIQNKHKNAGKSLFEDRNAFQALSDIFVDILKDLGSNTTWIAVDALDECLEDRDRLLNLIVRTASSVKWIVSSRNLPEIEKKLRPDNSSLRLSLELKDNAAQVSKAIGVYIKHKISELDVLQDDISLRDQVHDILLRKAGDTFLWVALVFEELENALLGDILGVVKNLPLGLERLYKRMIQHIQDLNRKQPKHAKFCLAILSTICLSYRPLTLLELQVVVSVVEYSHRDLERIVRMCGSFLNIRESRVYLVHQSAKDYLTQDEDATATLFPTGPHAVHRDIFTRSLEAMSDRLRRNIYGLPRPGIAVDDITSHAPDPDPLAAIGYACVHWIGHLCEGFNAAFQPDIDDGGSMVRFLKSHFLHWLEALSILRGISDGILALKQLETLLQVCQNNKQ